MKDLLQLIGFALLIILFFGSIVYPMSVERSFKEIYGKKGLSYGWAFVQLIGIFVCYAAYQDHDNRWKLFLGIIFCICTFVIAVKSLGKKLREIGCDNGHIIVMQIGQILLPIGLIVVVFIISGIMRNIFEEKEKNKKE